jgi:hypothetical protein
MALDLSRSLLEDLREPVDGNEYLQAGLLGIIKGRLETLLHLVETKDLEGTEKLLLKLGEPMERLAGVEK